MKRFWDRVNKNGVVPASYTGVKTCCWIWIGAKNKPGYGHLWFEGKLREAHRVSFFLEHGRWPEPCGLHRCDTPACVRPSHIFEGTKGDNNRDTKQKGRFRPRFGEAHPRTKLTDQDIMKIRLDYAVRNLNQRELAAKYGVSAPQISRIVSGKQWRAVVTGAW